MVTEQEYLKAKEVIFAYEKDQDEKRLKDKELRKIAQEKRELECTDHYFIEDGYMTNTRTCQFCGKKI